MVVFILFLICNVLGLQLEGNYKPWDSSSNKYLFDYSLNNRHVELVYPSASNLAFSTRGLHLLNECLLVFPHNSFNSGPAKNQAVFSYWIFLTGGMPRFFHITDVKPGYTTDNYLWRIFLTLESSQIKLTPQRQILGFPVYTYNTPSSILYGSIWRFLVFVFTQQGANVLGTVYMNQVKLFEYSTSNFYINSPTLVWTASSGGGKIIGIIHEIWWHGGFSSIADLETVMRSSSYYISEYNLSISSQGFTIGPSGTTCSTSCTSKGQSCDINSACIGTMQASCYLGIVQTNTNQCLYYCPDNSCNCLTTQNTTTNENTLTCGCEFGYNKISESPLACIDFHCETYTKNGYVYTCTKCEEGYVWSSNKCVCDAGYITQQATPLKCAWNTFRCTNYVEGPTLYTCGQCEIGYIPGCSGRCCVCDAGYREFIASPIKCGYDVYRCSNYIEGETLFTCTQCIEGYKLGCSGRCCVCDAGYIEIKANPIACAWNTFRCISYIEGEPLHTCGQCEAGYIPGCNGRCCVCDENWVQVVDNPIECTPAIDHCISYIKKEGIWVCEGCSEGYRVDFYDKCYDCDAGYSMVTNNPFTCASEIPGCVVYENSNNEWICEECAVGYLTSCNQRCCECDLDRGYIQVAYNPTICISKIFRCIEYRLYEITWGCGICEGGYDIDTEIKCNKCKEGYVIYSEDPYLCLSEIKYCDKYILLETGHACSICKDEYRLCLGKCCECPLGYYVSKSKPEECLECPSNCTKCKDIQNELVCTGCNFGYIVIGGRCQCDLEDFYMRGDSCIVKPLEVTLNYDYNSIVIIFSKLLSAPLTISDFKLTFHEELDGRLLTYELLTIEDRKEYQISFRFLMNINQYFSISLTFSDKVSDRQALGLITKVQYTTLPLEVEGITARNELCDASCLECEMINGRLGCSMCYDYAYFFEGLCRCYTETADTKPNACPAGCPEGMVINSDLRICEACRGCYDEDLEDNNSDQDIDIQKENTRKAKEYSDFSETFSSASSTTAFALGSALGADKLWSLMNTIQIYTYLPLLKVNMPLYLQESLKSQDSSSKYFDYLKEYFQRGTQPITHTKYESAFLVENIMKPITVITFLIVGNILIYFINHYSSGKLNKYSGIVLKFFYLRIYLRYFIQIYMDLLIPCILQVLYVMYN